MAALFPDDPFTVLPLDISEAGTVPTARLLVFDTSTELLAVGASGPAGSYTALAPGGAAASAHLLPLALRVMAQAGLQLQDLQAVAFGGGPGAFTGLRTACAVAQGLGLGLGIPVLPVDSLMVVAEDARLQWQGLQGGAAAGPLTVDVVMDARMNELYAARYRWATPHPGPASSQSSGGPWQVLRAPQLCSLAAWAAWADGADGADGAATPPVTVVAGSALQAFADRMTLPAQVLQRPAEANRAAALLRLALHGWALGQAVDPALAMPLYGRDKVAQTTLEREQARAAAATLAAAAATSGAGGTAAQTPPVNPARAPRSATRP